MEPWRWMILWQAGAMVALSMLSACTPSNVIADAWYHEQWPTKNKPADGVKDD